GSANAMIASARVSRRGGRGPSVARKLKRARQFALPNTSADQKCLGHGTTQLSRSHTSCPRQKRHILLPKVVLRAVWVSEELFSRDYLVRSSVCIGIATSPQ